MESAQVMQLFFTSDLNPLCRDPFCKVLLRHPHVVELLYKLYIIKLHFAAAKTKRGSFCLNAELQKSNVLKPAIYKVIIIFRKSESSEL